MAKNKKEHNAQNKQFNKIVLKKDPKYLYRMTHALPWGESSALYVLIPIIIFAAVTILIVRMHVYSRPMSQFYWTPDMDTTQLTDFFSYNKMLLIIITSVIALIILLFMFASQSLAIKRTPVYIPILVYVLFVLISYFGSDYKEFALLGYNDRFEGTIPILCYMLMLFFIINTINSELNIKQLIWPIAISSTLLSILGITQALGHDFFRTVIGQKLISPNYSLADGSTVWQAIDNAFKDGALYFNFTFQNREIYQTVYNINYVSFYLTLLIPLFGMLFIRSIEKDSKEPFWKKIGLGVLCAIILFNFIGSASSGGFIGLIVIGILGIVILNKQLLRYWRALLILFVVAGIILGSTASRWIPELSGAFRGLKSNNIDSAVPDQVDPTSIKPTIDYIKTGEYVQYSINGSLLIIDLVYEDEQYGIGIYDEDFNPISLQILDDGYFRVIDDRFEPFIKIGVTSDSDGGCYLDVITGDTEEWVFTNENGYFQYYNRLGYMVDLDEIEHIGFEGHYNFGSKRGYIWATSLPMLRNTIIKGYGADTFCIYYPQKDYAGKYNANYNINTIVDKPHNMYLHAAICTGCFSVIALLTIYGIYVIQSIRLFWKRELGNDYLSCVGFGLFCGLTGFMVTGLVDDSTVSVMPLFYTLLGCGIAVNLMIKRNDSVSRAFD